MNLKRQCVSQNLLQKPPTKVALKLGVKPGRKEEMTGLKILLDIAVLLGLLKEVGCGHDTPPLGSMPP
jgi:hypothetical protein